MSKILLVEDDEAHAELILRAFTLGEGKQEIARASSLQEALAFLSREEPDFVLTDYRLPDGEGLELMGEHEAGGPIRPVLVLTSHGSETVAAEAIKRGALDYVVKSPESFETLPTQVIKAKKTWETIIQKRDTETKLRRSLAEKEVIIKEVHHRVKNNFQIVSSLLSLQAQTMGEGPTKKALVESENRIRSMALIHEKLYESHDYSGVDFADYLRGMASRLEVAYRGSERGIAMAFAAEPLTFSIETAIPLGLVLNELVTNALIHAFPGGRQGEIRISLQAESSQAVFSESDTGVGMPPDLDMAAPKTLGFELVRVLTTQAGGLLELRTGSWGTDVTIRVPLPS